MQTAPSAKLALFVLTTGSVVAMADRPARPIQADRQAFIHGNNAFAADLCARLST